MDSVQQDRQRQAQRRRTTGPGACVLPLSDPRAVAAVDLASRRLDVAVAEVVAPRRGTRRVALCRQVAMYLCHVQLGISMTGTGRLFGRDRTTVAHACRLVEDLRDAEHMDQLIAELEAALHSVIAAWS